MALSCEVVVRPVDRDSADFNMLLSRFVEELESRYPGLSDETPPEPEELQAVIAYRGDIPVGCGALVQIEPRVAEVKRVYVSSEARRLGVARAILKELEAQGRSAGYSTLRLGTGIRQPEALALYESCGYKRIPLFGEYEGAELCVCFEKTLA